MIIPMFVEQAKKQEEMETAHKNLAMLANVFQPPATKAIASQKVGC